MEPAQRPDRAPEVSPANQRMGVTVEDLEDGSVRLSAEADPSFHNEVGTVHGGLVAFLVDGAMGRAAGRSLGPGETTATLQLSVQFLAPARGQLQATGRLVRRGRTVAFLEAECLGQGGAIVARAHGVWTVRSRPA